LSSSTGFFDPYYPKAWTGHTTTTSETVDGCLGRTNSAGVYHYKILSPCIVNYINFSGKSSCSSISSCSSGLKDYAFAPYGYYRQETLLGVAKDGHMILGPYGSDGIEFNCNNQDQCGGLNSNDGSYVYVFSTKFPYTVNCFGPG
jgi:hypothetical protein